MLIGGRLAKIALTALVLMFIFSGFLGTAHLGMDMQMEGMKGLCPLMPGVVICNMTPMQHVTAAQSLFKALPIQIDFSMILLAFLAAVIGFLPLLRQALFPPIPTSVRPVVVRGYIPTHIALQEVFARGILNPKLF